MQLADVTLLAPMVTGLMQPQMYVNLVTLAAQAAPDQLTALSAPHPYFSIITHATLKTLVQMELIEMSSI